MAGLRFLTPRDGVRRTEMCSWGRPAFACLLIAVAPCIQAAEVVELNAANWDSFAPKGKEVDAIYGDYALTSDRLMAVVAKPAKSRHANLAVRHVGGALIDFTNRTTPNDQFICFYPHGRGFRLEGPIEWPTALASPAGSCRLAFRAKPPSSLDDPSAADLEITVAYEMSDGTDYLTVRSVVSNKSDHTVELDVADGVRIDGDFKFGYNHRLNLWWCFDEFRRQAFGVQPVDHKITFTPRHLPDWQTSQLKYQTADGPANIQIAPGQSIVLDRRIYTSSDTSRINALAQNSHGDQSRPVSISVVDGAGAVGGALVQLESNDEVIGTGRADREGKLNVDLPAGGYCCRVTAPGRNSGALEFDTASRNWNVRLPDVGYVEAAITDDSGDGIPCKVSFFGKGVADPDFGPISAVHGVQNLRYTHNGRFRVPLLPGEYDVLISHGIEYDAVAQPLSVMAGQTIALNATLKRTVDTTGWLSADMHSHSTKSGDNTASQRGRVLNLLAEQLEFIPCTEHNRISSYERQLKYFGAADRVITCPGLELTGESRPLNHQGAFPLVVHERVQDGGAPRFATDPETQIARLAGWDDGSAKVVQINHPNIPQIFGDRDLDGHADQGFRSMLQHADQMELAPIQLILADDPSDTADDAEGGNKIAHWLQLLNLGYRITGVANTDSHWNFHGSGWLRNYIRASSDEPHEAQLSEICRSLKQGQVVMTNGPFLSVTASCNGRSCGPGEELAFHSGEIQIKVRVQCANWLDVNRVQILLNGRLLNSLNFTRRDHAEMFGDGVVKFDNVIPLQLTEDAHVIVVTANEGKMLGRIYGPEQGTAMPIAVSNPLYIDVDGDGFHANGDLLDLDLPIDAAPVTMEKQATNRRNRID